MNKFLGIFKIKSKQHQVASTDKMNIMQIFTPALKICPYNADSSVIISKRIWLENNDNSQTDISKHENSIQNMGYIGSMQIEETWKHYYRNLYISNLGYTARFDDDAKNIFADKFDDFSQDGVVFRDLTNDQKNYIRQHINFKNNGLQAHGYSPSSKGCRRIVCKN